MRSEKPWSADIHAWLCSYVTLRILDMDAEDKVCRDARAWVRSGHVFKQSWSTAPHGKA